MIELVGKITKAKGLKGSIQGTSGVSSNYDKLTNKPRINGVELIQNKTAEELLLQSLMMPVSNQEIEDMFK